MNARRGTSLKYTVTVIIAVTAALALFFRFGAAAGNEFALSREGFSMNTVIRITVLGQDEKLLTEALGGAFSMLERLNGELSLYSDASALADVNAHAGETGAVPVPPDVLAVINDAVRIRDMTGGAFNPLIGPITKLWKINQDPNDSASFKLPGREDLDAALALTDRDTLEIGEGSVRLTKRGAALDMGGIAKGYASSRIAAFLSEKGIKSALIDLGGNIQVIGTRGGRPWNIGIRDPLNPRQAPVMAISAADTAIITSGGYERYKIIDGVRYSHFFDPRTGMPVKNDILSATLITPDGSAADALATAFMVMGFDESVKFLKDNPKFNAVLIREGTGRRMEIFATLGLKDKIFKSASDVNFF